MSYFALPALLFKNMVELNFDIVTWSLVLAIFLAKSAVFVIVFFMSMVVGGGGIGRAGLYGIFATQSNDFAMGYPIIQVLYSQSYPELIQYIYLLAPVQLLILNPLGFTFLEISKQQSSSSEVANEFEALTTQSSTSSAPSNDSTEPQPPTGKFDICKKVIKGLIKNPVVIMVFVGLIFHFIFSGKLPAAIDSIMTTLSNAFSASALFYLGLTMVGKISSQKGPGLFIPAGLVTAKILLVPIFARGFMALLGSEDLHQPGVVAPPLASNTTTQNGTSYLDVLSDFAYLYGMIPTAPSVIIFATQYGVEIDRMATSMVACTALSAPIMYISAWSLTYSSVTAEYFSTLISSTYMDLSYVGIFCTVWCILIFIANKKHLRVPHMITLALTCAMLVMSIFTAISTSATDDHTSPKLLKTLFAFSYFGMVSCRFLTSSLAIALLILEYHGEDAVRKSGKLLIGVPIGLAFIWSIITTFAGKSQPILAVDVSAKSSDTFTLIMTLVMLIFSFSITTISLVILFKKTGQKRHQDQPTYENVEDDITTNDVINTSQPDDELLFADDEDTVLIHDDVTDITSSQSSSIHQGGHQFTRHVCLLMCLSVSMLVGTVLIVWQINGSTMTGSYTELSFLDSVCSVGQGVFVFFIFGFNHPLIMEPFVKLYNKITGRSGKDIQLPDWSDMEPEVLRTCAMFVKYNYDDCRKSIEKQQRRSMRSYEQSFTGTSLVQYLIDNRLASNRHEATLFGEDLLKGRVLRHVKNQHHFHDTLYCYQFNEPSCTISSPNIQNQQSTTPINVPSQIFEFENYLMTSSITCNRRQNNSSFNEVSTTGCHGDNDEDQPQDGAVGTLQNCANQIAAISSNDDKELQQ